MGSSQVFSLTRKRTRGRSRTSSVVDRRTGKQVTKSFYMLHHFLAQFILCNPLHCGGNELQIGVEGDVELDLIPNVRKKRPGIIINDFVGDFLIRKLDQPTAWMIAGQVLAAEFPKSGIKISNVNLHRRWLRRFVCDRLP